jgi:hypothetical protein
LSSFAAILIIRDFLWEIAMDRRLRMAAVALVLLSGAVGVSLVVVGANWLKPALKISDTNR